MVTSRGAAAAPPILSMPQSEAPWGGLCASSVFSEALWLAYVRDIYQKHAMTLGSLECEVRQ